MDSGSDSSCIKTKSFDDTSSDSYVSQQTTRKHAVKAPIYITIGPQASGKTSHLSNLKRKELPYNSTKLQDITIDDQNGVYIATPNELWFRNQQPSRRNSTEQMSSFLQTNVHGKTISERIYDDQDNYEMRFVVQRLNDVISSHDFRQHISSLGNNADGGVGHVEKRTNLILRKLYKKESNSVNRIVDWKEILIGIVEQFHRSKSNFDQSNHVQLFIVDSIFKNQTPTLSSLLSTLSINDDNEEEENITGTTNSGNINESVQKQEYCNRMSGLNAAIKKLTDIAINQLNVPIAWGNTNAKVTDYVAALDAAQKSQRPVIFIPYMDKRQSQGIIYHLHQDEKKNNQTGEGDKMTILPRLDMNELFQRNIQRCYLTGKYVPMRVIIDTCLGVDSLVDKAINEMKIHFQKKHVTSSAHFSKFELDNTFARMAGFHMNNDRTVNRIVAENKKGPPQRNLSNSNNWRNSSGNGRRGNSNGKSKGRGRGR